MPFCVDVRMPRIVWGWSNKKGALKDGLATFKSTNSLSTWEILTEA